MIRKMLIIGVTAMFTVGAIACNDCEKITKLQEEVQFMKKQQKSRLFVTKKSWLPTKVGVVLILLAVATLQVSKAEFTHNKLLKQDIPQAVVSFKVAAWELFKFCTVTVGLDWTLDEMKVYYVKAWNAAVAGLTQSEVDVLARKIKLTQLLSKYPELAGSLDKWKLKVH